MIEIRETTKRDLALVKSLWADGDVMRFVGFPEGVHQTDEDMMHWFEWIVSSRPATIRSVVDLPQPEGPTRTMNSLSSISRQKSETAVTLPE